MNEEMEKAMNALAGGTGTAGAPAGDAVDWKAKYEEMERKFQSAQVEQGRVKKLDEEKKALEAKLAELSSKRRSQEAISSLPDNLREAIPDDYAEGTSLIAQRTVDAALAARDAELAAIKAQMAEKERRAAKAANDSFGVRIEQAFPGFLKSAVLEGGDKHAAWVQYQRYNAGSINAAVAACDFDTLSYHIRKFYTDELGIVAPSGGTGAAAPDPSATGGGTPAARTAGKAYTEDELDALFDKKEAARDRGDWAEVKRLTDEINRAQAAGAK